MVSPVEELKHEHQEKNPLLTVARLDTMVTVVDAFTFFDRLSELARVKDQQDAEGNEDESRTLSELMVQQGLRSDEML